MPRSSAQITDAALRAKSEALINDAGLIAAELAKRTRYSRGRVLDYAFLAAVTGVPFDRVLTYLRDCKTPESARGRLLMRAAERVLREMGEADGPKYQDEGRCP